MRNKAVAALTFFLLFAGAVLASDWEKKTVVTFAEPVIVAGVPVVTLEPGTYVVRLMNHDHNRNIVQFFNERGDQLFTTVLAIPNYRLVPQDKTVFRFWETPRGNPVALHAWFFPGDNWGQEFVYPKGLAAKLARDTGERVLTTPAETAAELATAPVAEVTQTGEEQPLEEAIAAPEPAPVAEAAPVEVAEAAPPAAVAEPEPAPLPATASPFFMIGLIGLLAAISGLGLRRLAVRKS